MAKVITITVGIETSIKIAEYQYINPRIDITYSLDEGEQAGKVMAEARNRLTIEMNRLEKHIRIESVPSQTSTKAKVDDKDLPF